MSRAFVKDQDGTELDGDVPERVVSPHRNLVTADGLARIDEELRKSRDAIAVARAADDRAAAALHARDLRYWTQRRATAQTVEPPKAPKKVAFATRVTVKRHDGREQVFSIVGEDEADLEKGLIAYTVPMARALLGLEVGEEAELPGGHIEVIDLKPIDAKG